MNARGSGPVAMNEFEAIETDGSAEAPGERVSLGSLENSAGFVLRIAQLTVFERFFAILGESEMRISEFTVLYAVAGRADDFARAGIAYFDRGGGAG